MIPPKKVVGRAHAGHAPDLWVKYLFDPRHDIVRTGQRDSVSQRAVTLSRADFFPIRAVFRPPIGQPHKPLTLQLRGKTNTPTLWIALIPERKGIDRPR